MKALLVLSFLTVLASVSLVSVPAPAANPCIERCVQKKAAAKGSCGTMCGLKCKDRCVQMKKGKMKMKRGR